MNRRRRTPADRTELESELRALRSALVDAEADRTTEIENVHPVHRRAAANLVHYVELRQHDIRSLQARLGSLGLSSLGRSEPHVLATLEAVLAVVSDLNGTTAPGQEADIAMGEHHELLDANADGLLGRAPPQRSTRIMVTLPSEASGDPSLVALLVEHGMDIARINCAHDDQDAWAHMVDSVRACTTPDGRSVRIAMDLAGPKLRTGPVQPGPRAIRVAPQRDHTGHVVTPALLTLVGPRSRAPLRRRGAVGFTLPVSDASWLRRRHTGDQVRLCDSRGAQRLWTVLGVGRGTCRVSTEQTTYVTTGTALVCDGSHGDDVVTVGQLPQVQQAHHVNRGDHLILTRSMDPMPLARDGEPHRIGCSLPEAFLHANNGERVWLDDGKIGGTITSVTHDEITVAITEVRPGGANLRADKGINMPETNLQLSALTTKDLADLPFVAQHADVVDLSFVREPADVRLLQDLLHDYEADELGIVLKIENVAAFENLPELLLTAMRSAHVGVMIARGDLAVELGFERLAEVQEEIMWACEAAHVPVIWATQVLDTLAKTGQPSRAEVSDAAMSERAECVMLNKGPHIVDAMETLDSILTRMHAHQDKKSSLLRRLHSWDHPPADNA